MSAWGPQKDPAGRNGTRWSANETDAAEVQNGFNITYRFPNGWLGAAWGGISHENSVATATCKKDLPGSGTDRAAISLLFQQSEI